MDSAFDLNIGPLWLQEIILEKSNNEHLKKLYSEYKENGTKISTDDKFYINLICVKGLNARGPFDFTFVESSKPHEHEPSFELIKPSLRIQTHVKAMKVAEILQTKRIESCASLNEHGDDIIDSICYDEKHQKWLEWESK